MKSSTMEDLQNIFVFFFFQHCILLHFAFLDRKKSGIHILDIFFFVVFYSQDTWQGRVPFESLNWRLSSYFFLFFTSSTSGRLLRSNRYTTVAQHRIGISLLKKDLREELVLVLYNADGIRKCSCPFRLRLRPKKLAGTAERSLLHMIDGGRKKYEMRWMSNYFEWIWKVFPQTMLCLRWYYWCKLICP